MKNGPDLRAERARRGVSQKELARRLGCTPGRVSAIENSVRVTDAYARRYLDALGAQRVSPEARFDEALDELLAEAST
jgi:transcriptional regulator with XRE-family HTH domain